MNKLIQWIKPSFEGDDGKASYRRLSALVLLFVIVYLAIFGKITTSISLYMMIVLASMFLLLVGIMTVDNIIALLNNCKDKLSEKLKDKE